MKLLNIFLNKLLEWGVYLRNKTWSPFFAEIEKRRFPNLYKQGREIRMGLKIYTVKQLCEYLEQNDFRWESDPLYGSVDYESYPEITLAKKKGDCDDYSRLAVELLQDNYQKVWKLYCFGKLFDGHAVALFYNQNGWKVLSNTEFFDLGKDSTNIAERAAKLFYGDRLSSYAIEKVKDK